MRPIINRITYPMTTDDWLLLWCSCIAILFIVLYLSSYDELMIWCDQDILDKAFIPKFHTSKFNGSSTSPVDAVHYMDLQNVLTDFSDPIGT